MKRVVGILLIVFFTSLAAHAQAQRGNFSAIDQWVETVDAPSADSLARKIALQYRDDLEKVRAIFRWITNNISYNTLVLYRSRKPALYKSYEQDDDTLTQWKAADEMVADQVFSRRTAVCEGYTKLFRVMCEAAGVRCVALRGYVRSGFERRPAFRTNHTWNAVLIDSTWYLADVTWASGYTTWSNEFIRAFDENYFLAAPARFIRTHLPEDLQWTLIDEPPAMSEFRQAPYRTSAFAKYQIQSVIPAAGTIKVRIGDTVQIELESKDPVRDQQIAPGASFDSSTFDRSPLSVFLAPHITGKKISYSYVVADLSKQWIHLVYNDDVILRYKLEF